MTARKTISPEMLSNILSTPNAMRKIYNDLNRSTRSALSHEDILGTKRMLITGCGDSYYAGIASKFAFEHFAGLSPIVAPALETSRYLLLRSSIGNYPFNPLVLATSVSGEIARTVEVIKHAKQVNALTCAVTSNPKSRAAQEADRTITVPIFLKRNTNEHVPGTLSFTKSMMALFLLAYHFAEVHDFLSVEKVNHLDKEMVETSDIAEEVLERSVKPIENAAARWKKASSFIVLGSGPNYATALFTAAKIVEAAGCMAVGLDIEEWAHLYYFCSDPNPRNINICPEW